MPATGFNTEMEIPEGGIHFMIREAAIVSANAQYLRCDSRRLNVRLTRAIITYKRPFIIQEDDPILNWEHLSQKVENQGFDAILYPTCIGREKSNCVVVWSATQIKVIDANHTLTLH